MKYILITIMIVLALSFTSCSLLTPYLPTNVTQNDTPILDDFNFTDDITENVTIDLPEDEDILNDSTQNETEEPITEDVFATITATEGDLVSLRRITAMDPDGASITYSYEDPFNSAGLWQTNEGDEGKYLTTITASDGILSTTEFLQVVILPSNKAPVIDCPEFIVVSEGDLIDLPCTIYDREGDEVTFAVSGFMNDLTYQTDFGDAGDYTAVITATDGNKAAVKEIDIIIQKQNRAPVVEPIEPIVVTELETVVLDVEASDPDGDSLSITYPLLFDDTGVWQTQRGDAGSYDLNLVVTDGTANVVVPVLITVTEVNLPPVVEPIEPITVDEGETIVIDVVANDPDGDELTISYDGFMNASTYTTTYDDAGEHEVTITVSDGLHTVSTTVAITVENVNRPPVFVLN
jgi:hypothetical protein